MNRIRLDVYSHHVTVTGYNRLGMEALKNFCRTLAQFGMIRTPHGQFQRVMLKVFAAATADRLEYRFHRHLLDDLVMHLEACGVYLKQDIEVVHHKAADGLDVKLKMNEVMVARDYQEPIIEFMTLNAKEKEDKFPKHRRVVTLQTGRGKDQPLTALIKIPGGWKYMGEMKVGDTVTAWDGTPSKVTGVFPQGTKEVYRVTFKDGRSTLVGKDHLWKVYYVNTSIERRWRIVTTMEMLRLISMPNPRVYVPLCIAEEGEEKEFPIPPYTLGVLLGDGCTSGTSVTITKMDSEIFEFVNDELHEDLKLTICDHLTKRIVSNGPVRNAMIEKLKSLDLMGKRSWEKHIPNEYLYGSRAQRLSLLQGLMDTDGTVGNKGGSVSFCTTSKALALGVQYLVRSLGGMTSVRQKFPSFTYKGEKKEGRIAYQLNIRYPKPSELFRLSRKQERTNDENQYAADLKLQVISVVPEGVEETQCISIDHPDHLYVTDDFIVTHNTFCALKSLSILQKRTVIVIKGMYVKKWISDVEEAFKKHRKAIWKKGDLLVVRGSKNLVDLIELAKAGELTAKVIIITNTTMQNYINDYESSNGTSEMYGCKPQEFYPLLNAGIRLIDEAHQDFHLNFKQDLYTHVPLTLELSATLKPDDKFLDRMYHIMFPVESRYRGGEYVKYISVTAVMYNMKEARRHRHKRRGQYSHVLFEQTMMKDKRRLAAYLDLISRVVHNYFIMKQSPGQKLLVFGATVDFCQILTAHLKNYMSEFSFCCYVSGTDYAKLLESDCTVSTLKSAGTAVDIPGLRTVLMTDSLNSGQANDQALGRLRKLAKWPEATPEFIYLVCVDIDKHMQYHRRKVEHFTGKVIAHKEVHSGVII